MRLRAVLLLVLGAAAVTAPGLAQVIDRGAMEVDGRRSGYLYLGNQVQALQDDDFLNPGMFAVEDGRALWSTPDPATNLSCASCHGAAEESMRGVATRYPRFDATRGRIINMELAINRERVERMGAAPLPYESPELLALTAYVTHQSRGMAKDVDVTGPAAPFFEEGRAFFFQRRGQLDLSCSQCHDDRAGMLLRGDVISQGQINGFPFYRLIWSSVASTHRMFEWCNTSVRAEPYPLGSDVYLALELYVAWRGRGLAIETPAVRR
jgi:sulfur-oxidizing protein SoxA